MILEAYTWALSKAAPGARKAGLVYEAAAIAARYNRQKKAWHQHLLNTRAAIAAAVEKADPTEPILVLGAGLGLDLPLAALNKHPAGALLCDAVFTPQLRFRMRTFRNLSFEVADATGLLAPFWEDKGNTPISPPAIAPIPLTGFSLAVSCNLLSQLPLSFAKSPPEGETEVRLTAAIQQAHLKALKAMDCPTLLITDYMREETMKGTTQTVSSSAPQLVFGDPAHLWNWNLAPEEERGKGLSTLLKVGVWEG
jgi:hypothetical protein